MAIISIRNLPEEVHRALLVRAANHGRSTEAEVRNILEQAVVAEGLISLDSLLVAIGRDADVSNAGIGQFERCQAIGKAADYE